MLEAYCARAVVGTELKKFIPVSCSAFIYLYASFLPAQLWAPWRRGPSPRTFVFLASSVVLGAYCLLGCRMEGWDSLHFYSVKGIFAEVTDVWLIVWSSDNVADVFSTVDHHWVGETVCLHSWVLPAPAACFGCLGLVVQWWGLTEHSSAQTILELCPPSAPSPLCLSASAGSSALSPSGRLAHMHVHRLPHPPLFQGLPSYQETVLRSFWMAYSRS